MFGKLAIWFRRTQGWFRPDLESRFARQKDFADDLNLYSFVVGIVAVGLPAVLLFGGWLLSEGFDSISHYYFSRYLGGFFVIGITIIAATMFAFQGETCREKWLARAGGIFLTMVAFFPTSGPGADNFPREGRAFVSIELDERVKEPGQSLPPGDPIWREGCSEPDVFEDTKCAYIDPYEAAPEIGTGLYRHFVFVDAAPWLEYVHFFSAAAVFVLLFVFCVFIFPRIDPWHLKSGSLDGNGLVHGEVGDAKELRNRVYYACGGFIFVSLAALGGRALARLIFDLNPAFWDDLDLTFWFETLGLVAFGVAWSVRGRVWPALFNDEAERERIEVLMKEKAASAMATAGAEA